jgi:hypothetical protein
MSQPLSMSSLSTEGEGALRLSALLPATSRSLPLPAPAIFLNRFKAATATVVLLAIIYARLSGPIHSTHRGSRDLVNTKWQV